MRSRVVPGKSSTTATWSASMRLKKVDLPTFGRPTMATSGFIYPCPLHPYHKLGTHQGCPYVKTISNLGYYNTQQPETIVMKTVQTPSGHRGCDEWYPQRTRTRRAPLY